MSVENRWTVCVDTTQSEADGRKPLMPYQQEAIDSLDDYFDLSGKTKGVQSGMLVMPTGSGKTFTAVTWLLTRGVAQGYRIVWLVQLQELVGQAFDEFRSLAPIVAEKGIETIRMIPVASRYARMSMAKDCDVTVASIHSVANAYGRAYIRPMLGPAGREKLIVVIDEAHHAAMKSYQYVLNRLKRLNPNLILLGLTATPKPRQNRRTFLELFHLSMEVPTYRGPVYEIHLGELIKSHFLSIPRYERVDTQIVGDTAYQMTEQDILESRRLRDLPGHILHRMATMAARNKLIVRQYVKHRKRYGKTLVFAINQEHAVTLCKEFQEAGIHAEYVISDGSDSRPVIERFRAGAFPVLVNVRIMAEGVDVPDIQTVFLTRQTSSDVLFQQRVGRGLRGELAGGTRECFIVDFEDQWEQLNFWIHPEDSEIFTAPQEGAKEVPPAKTPVRRRPRRQIPSLLLDSYQAISSITKSLLKGKGKTARWPVGWYSLPINQDMYSYIIVFNGQEEAFATCLDAVRDAWTDIHADGYQLERLCLKFLQGVTLPRESRRLAQYIFSTQIIPTYFDLLENDPTSPLALAQKLTEKFGGFSAPLAKEQQAYLQEAYAASERMQENYRSPEGVVRAIEDLSARQRKAHIIEREERERYQLKEGCHDLSQLLENVYRKFPNLREAKIAKLYWSDRVLKTRYGMCEQTADGCRIEINCLVSSPQMHEETIEFLIYHELLHASGLWRHDEAFRTEEWKYPNRTLWEAELDRLTETYQVDFPLLREEWKCNKKQAFQLRKHTAGETTEGGAKPASGVTDGPEPGKEEVANEPYDPYFHADAPGVQAGIRYCGFCGTPMQQDSQVCPHCHQAVR